MHDRHEELPDVFAALDEAMDVLDREADEWARKRGLR